MLLVIVDWGFGPIPNPQSPIPNPQSPIPNPHDSSYIFFFSITYKQNNIFISFNIHCLFLVTLFNTINS